MQVNIKNLMDDAQCYDTVRELRWPEGRECPFCDSRRVIRRGSDEKEPARQRYECKDCGKRFDDLTGAICNSVRGTWGFFFLLSTKRLRPPASLQRQAFCAP